MSVQVSDARKQVEVKPGLFTSPLTPIEDVRMLGSKCKACEEVLLGKRSACEHCGGTDMEVIPLSRRGKVWTYTVIRHKPPAGYKGPDPFVPFGLGLIELPDGIRVISPIVGDVEKIHIGMELELEVYPLYTDENNNEVLSFRFRPV